MPQKDKTKKAQFERRAKVVRELQLAQDGFIPRSFYFLAGLDISGGCLQAKEVGGDFYEIFPLSSGKILIAVADLAGKGLSASLYSVRLRSYLRALAEMTESLPQIAAKANELFLLDAGDSGEFATLWLGILDNSDLHYARLGHPPALLKRKGELLELSTENPAIGLMAFDSISWRTQKLGSGDELLFYSDGATEAHDAQGQLYGLGRLKNSFLQSSDVDQILREIQSFSQEIPQHDDLTLLIIRFLSLA